MIGSRPRLWTSKTVVDKIIQNGCHLIPLIVVFFSFNHTQFLCYGLLKIVLKEYIQKMENYPENTLYSYFIKTDVLDDSRYSNWTVATKELSDLLCNVFYTFDISCKKEECPFFLPSRNNMLNNKATEKKQQRHLYWIYLKKFWEWDLRTVLQDVAIFFPSMFIMMNQSYLITNECYFYKNVDCYRALF